MAARTKPKKQEPVAMVSKKAVAAQTKPKKQEPVATTKKLSEKGGLAQNNQGSSRQHSAQRSSQPVDSALKTPSSSVAKYRDLQKLANTYGLDSKQIAALFGVPVRTQARYKKDDAVLNPLVVDRLERFKRIAQQAIDLFEDEAEAQRWLSTPNASLNNQTPLNAMATDGGAKQVEEILYRAEYGVYG
jgi:putative toxin-antitoxin system antitoxin component (TIGR02293 family)